MYDKTTFYYLDRILRSIIIATLVSGLGIAAMFYFIHDTSISRLFIGIFLMLCVVIMFVERCVIRMVYGNGSNNGDSPRIIIICTNDNCLLFQQYLKKTLIRYNVLGTVQVGEGDVAHDDICLGRLDDLKDILVKHVVDEVVFYMPKGYIGNLEQYVILCEQMGITVHLVANFYNLKLSRAHISMLGPLPVLTFHTVNLNPFQAAIKRIMDIVGSLVGIFITIFASLVIIPAIMLDSPGPVLFIQKRVGLNGRIFNLYKFRTMCVDAEDKKKELLTMNEHHDGKMFKIKEDPRITRVGSILRKASLDELPQFFNVLKGDMSLVGTRPPTMDEVAKYDYEQRRRISIKPGLTGMWQVNGRSDIKDFDQIVALDTQYIDKWSIGLDISILLKTLCQVLKMKSAY